MPSITVPTSPKQAFDTYTYGRNSAGTRVGTACRAAKYMHTSINEPVIGLMTRYRMNSRQSVQFDSTCQPSQVDQRSVRKGSVMGSIATGCRGGPPRGPCARGSPGTASP